MPVKYAGLIALRKDLRFSVILLLIHPESAQTRRRLVTREMP
jgi:hypothetical protein